MTLKWTIGIKAYRIFGSYVLMIFLIVIPKMSHAGLLCHGSFVNPLTDVCWSCIFPITIGSATVFSGDTPDNSSNPRLPVCSCGVRVGISTGFWEPAALVDVTRHPWCFVNLGGMGLDMGITHTGTVETASSRHNGSFYHVHWYHYPLFSLLKILTDAMCMESGDLDIASLSELDPTWGDDAWSFLMNPEAVLFGNPVAQAACAADSIASSVSGPIDSLFWCGGSQGSLYPMNGFVQEHAGDEQASLLLTERMAYLLHRALRLPDSVGQDGPALCFPRYSPFMPKSRYRYQMVNPLPTTGNHGCHPFGATTLTWEAGHAFPFKGEDFGYLVWKKRNCCAL